MYYIYMSDIKKTARAVILIDNKVILIRRKKYNNGEVIKEYYVIPGGHLDENETFEEENISLVYYATCRTYKSEVSTCTSDDQLIRLTSSSNESSKSNVKSANSGVFVTKDNKMNSLYFASIYAKDLKLNFDTLTFETNDFLMLENVSDMWYWTDGGLIDGGDLLVQSKDNKINYYSGIGLDTRVDGDTVIDFNEKVEKSFFYISDIFIVGEDNVYLALEDDDVYSLVTLDELKKYKDEIRGIYSYSGKMYVLLSNGNLYTAYAYY